MAVEVCPALGSLGALGYGSRGGRVPSGRGKPGFGLARHPRRGLLRLGETFRGMVWQSRCKARLGLLWSDEPRHGSHAVLCRA